MSDTESQHIRTRAPVDRLSVCITRPQVCQARNPGCALPWLRPPAAASTPLRRVTVASEPLACMSVQSPQHAEHSEASLETLAYVGDQHGCSERRTGQPSHHQECHHTNPVARCSRCTIAQWRPPALKHSARFCRPRLLPCHAGGITQRAGLRDEQGQCACALNTQPTACTALGTPTNTPSQQHTAPRSAHASAAPRSTAAGLINTSARHMLRRQRR